MPQKNHIQNSKNTNLLRRMVKTISKKDSGELKNKKPIKQELIKAELIHEVY